MAKISAYTEDTTPDRDAYVVIAIGGANYKVKILNLTTLMGPPQGQADNYKITTSVVTNDLTVALKTLAGADPTAADPIKVRIGNTVQSITAAISTTKTDGTNWCNTGAAETATQDVDFFVYLIQETGANAGTKIGFSRIPFARVMGDFVNTSNSEKYIAGNWVNFNATDEVENIGRFNASLTATATFNWSIPATSIIVSRPIFETRRLTYTPAVTSDTGTITTVGAVAGEYQAIGRNVNFHHSGAITTNGTGATAIRISTPFSFVLTSHVIPGRELTLTGSMLQGLIRAGYILWFNYNNTYPGGTGATVAGGGVAVL